MQTFAFIVLIALLIALTHTHNFVLRKLNEKPAEEVGGLIFMSSVVYCVIMFFLLKYIVLWGYPLIAEI